jgi:CHAD domain-containing protein
MDIKKKKSFRINAQQIIISLLDKLLLHQKSILGHPKLISKLHRIRIDAKPLRYMMELCEPVFGKGFKECFKEVKNMIELIGEIHDLDVALPILRTYRSELKLFNQTINKTTERIPAKDVTRIIREIMKKREQMFLKLCDTIKRWEKTNFRMKVITTMQ